MFISLSLLKSKKTNIHRGQVLSAVVEASNLNKTDVAEKAGYSRSSYYNHIEDKNLPYHILAAYGKAIKYDFTEEFPEMPKYLFEDPAENYNKAPTIEEITQSRDYWKDKYVELLEKYNKLIEERLSLGSNTKKQG